ncbi:sodium:proton antiporter [Devosia geojensis]|uniref:Sodium:proton antiporter n=1 Tax=Devosia geojensis TaxID=443610 RepID=A0A0F5FWW5_9HYPH|nr:Na+/H+ antiporter NhaC family protein [Devosia geojensis]KKB13349.1 sodium:proton antiporter [Devosia geojensis]
MSDQSPPPRPVREPTYLDAFVPLVTLAVLIAGSVMLFGLDAISGPLQVAIFLTAMATALILLKNGHAWQEIAEAGRRGVSSVVGAIFILFAVGALIGTWNMSGTIPTMVYYGLEFISPGWFYLATVLICGGIALGIGSSWTTAGTIGVGLVGLAGLLGISPAITAGAVISGAYLGDKLSPLSETSILAAQITGNDIFVHLRAQAWSSVPAFIIALAVFAALGATQGSGYSEMVIQSELASLDTLFWITPLNLLPLALLVALSVLKVPPSLAIIAAALMAGIMAALVQPEAVLRFVADPDLGAPAVFIKGIWMALANGYQANSGIPVVDALLSRGGMDSMLLTIWLIIGALVLGTLLDEFGLLSKLITPVLTQAKSTGQLTGTVIGTAFGLNVVSGDQYVALVLPARIFRAEFEKRGLATTNLSRAVADGGTVTSPLVPWNSCGAYMAAVLGVPTMLYAPFCIFNIASPLLTLGYGFTGFKMEKRAAPPSPRSNIPVGLNGP